MSISKKSILKSTLFILPLASISFLSEQAQANVIQDYTEFKKYVSDNWNIDYSVYIDYMAQAGIDNGGKIPYQSVYNPTLTWNLFNSDKYGKGSIRFDYKYVSYISKTEGSDMANQLGVVSPINGDPVTEPTFNWLAYTHTFNDTISITLGQFPFSNFDWIQFSGNQIPQTINDSLSGNASDIYQSAGMGAFVTVNPTSQISISTGIQTGEADGSEKLDFRNLSKKYSAFGSVSYSPVIDGLGSGTYSAFLYYQPSVEGTPESSVGFSLNAVQSIGEKWAVYASFNQSDASASIKASLMGGLMYLDPLNRNPNDQIGFVVGYNWLDGSNLPENARSKEMLMETYWAWGFTQYMQVVPDIQLYIKPALNKDKDAAAVFSLNVEFTL